MIVSSSARSAPGLLPGLLPLLLLALLLPVLVLSAAVSAAGAVHRPSEPTPPRPGARVDPALLHRSGTQVRLPPGATPPPALSARAWLVADAGTGHVLAARDAHRRLPPASTLKALFALTVLPKLSQTAQHTVAEEELTGIGAGSSLVGVKENLTYRIADLWRGVFLHSGNDAVRVLAGLNGGWEATARQMEATARSLGAMDTKVVSPTATTRRARSRPRTTSPSSGGRGCGTRTSRGTARCPTPPSPRAAGRTASATPTGCSPARTASRSTPASSA